MTDATTVAANESRVIRAATFSIAGIGILFIIGQILNFTAPISNDWRLAITVGPLAIVAIVGLTILGRRVVKRDRAFAAWAQETYGLRLNGDNLTSLWSGKTTQIDQATWVCLFEKETGIPSLHKVAG